ncbi:hypothetical protein ACIBHX_02200 [Nonomuraea sp. NPDC050536]|uniref:hypothetical protein n=1 Tax=Nonomuraea sp. NPDC050536 TaxID=3364366 RepID=UPI0037C872DE
MTLSPESEQDIPELPAPSRRGLLGRAVGWVQRDHLRRGPIPVIAGAVTLAEAAHLAAVPAWFGLPVTVVGVIGMYAREMNLPGQRTPVRSAVATLAAGSWVSAATAWGVTAGTESVPGLMAMLGLATAGLAYWAYRKDPAIVQALAWQQARTDWHMRAARYGLTGSHLLDWRETRLGEQFELDTVGTGRRASTLAGPDLDERIAEQEGLPTSRVKTRPGVIAGRLTVSIRYKDPWAEDLPHPLLDPTPEIILPDVADAREPIIIGMDPETGRPLALVLWDEDGAKRVVIVALPGAGKSVTLNNIYERLTAADNAWPIGINVSKAKELRRWRRSLGASACGPGERVKALHLLELAGHLIDYRGSLDDADEATVEPTAETKLVPVVVDEMDELLAHTDGLGMATRKAWSYVMSKGRSEAVAAVLVGTRGTATYMGGGNSRTMVDQVVLGKVNRKSEMQHAAGEFGVTLPNMAQYGEGKAGVLLVADIGGQYATGRGWRLDKLTDIDKLTTRRSAGELAPAEMAYLREQMGADLVAALLSNEPWAPPAKTGRRSTPQPSTAPETAMPTSDNRGAAARANAVAVLTEQRLLDVTLTPGQRRLVAIERRKQAAAQTDLDPRIRSMILAMASAPEGTSTRRIEEALEKELGQERGLSRNGAWRYLDVLRFEGAVELRGKGRSQSWHAVTPDLPEIDVDALIDEAEDDAIDNAHDYEE